MTELINRITVIPTRVSDPLHLPGQQARSEHSGLEGERPMTKDKHLLGKFELGGIPPAPRGQPQIEVTVEIDSKGSDEQKAIAQATCLQTAADHESTGAARKRN